jgi:hypothetical protein
VERLASLNVPDAGRFALIGDAHSFDGGKGMASCCELLAGFGDAGLDGGDELKGIVLVPTREMAMLALEFWYLDQEGAAIPRMRVHLLELDLMRGHWVALGIENEEA